MFVIPALYCVEVFEEMMDFNKRMKAMERVAPTRQQLSSALHHVAQMKPDFLPPLDLPKPNMRQRISFQYEVVFSDQLSLVEEKGQQDLF